MGESGVIDYAKFMVEDIPESMKGEERHFSIEISIVMRKPKGHFSRAPGVVLDILRDFGGGTFFEGQGYWKGVQEPVVYILISTIGRTEDIINLVRRKITSAQLKLRQQEAFVKINGSTFAGNLLDKSVTDNFPKQWEFDSDMKKITANQSRTNEHYNLIYGRVDYDNGDFEGAQKKWRDMIHEFAQKDHLSEIEKRDLLKCYSNILSPKLTLDEQFVNQICHQFDNLLAPNAESEFSAETLSPHAEGRMRGNRLRLYHLIGNKSIEESELVEDGFFAINQIVNHLDKGMNPYLEKDPIQDISTIFKHILELDNNQGSRIDRKLDILIDKFPAYENEFREMII
tara:strand:+ start:780 stop:1808 length:1029 start_codon:yes stop_codon:yes gene_type:complete